MPFGSSAFRSLLFSSGIAWKSCHQMAVSITCSLHSNWPSVLSIASPASTHPAISSGRCFIRRSFGISETADFWSYLEDAVDNVGYRRNRDVVEKTVFGTVVEHYQPPETIPFTQLDYSTWASIFDQVCRRPVIADTGEPFGTYFHTFDFHTFIENWFISGKLTTTSRVAALEICV